MRLAISEDGGGLMGVLVNTIELEYLVFDSNVRLTGGFRTILAK